MSNYKKHLIIYCSENAAVATHLSHALQAAGHEAMILEKTKSDFSEQIGQISLPAGAEALFLLTDNFLKAYGCMNGILQAAHNWGDAGRLSAVVAHGSVKDEDGEMIAVETTFERVSEIIQYMNYWQDKYLSLRKDKRSRPNDEILDEKIAITKEISGDVGEFLRYVRGIGYDTLEAFYEKYGLNADVQMAEEDTPPVKNGEHEKSKLVEIIKGSSEELMAENAGPKDNNAEEDSITEEVLSSIPGMDMLEERSTEDEAKKETNEMYLNDFTKKEMQKIDEENDELMDILDQVMVEEGLTNETGEGALEPDISGDFDIDSLLTEEEEEVEEEEEEETNIEMSEEDVLVSFVDEEDNGPTSDEILEQAVEYFREEEIPEGIRHLEEAVASHPADTSLRYYLAYAHARYASNYEQAALEIDHLLGQDEEHPDAWFLKGELLENKQDFAGARECFERVVAINPSFPDAQYRLGLLLVEQFEEDGKAADHLKAAVEQNERNADAHYMLASLLSEKMNEPEKAVLHFRKTLNLYPKHPFANYDLALVYHSLHDRERAAEFYEKAIAINGELKTEQNDLAFGLIPAQAEVMAEPETENGYVETELEITNLNESSDLAEESVYEPIADETVEDDVADETATAAAENVTIEPLSDEEEVTEAIIEGTIEEIITETTEPEAQDMAETIGSETIEDIVEEAASVVVDSSPEPDMEEVAIGETIEEIAEEMTTESVMGEGTEKMALVPDSVEEMAALTSVPIALSIVNEPEDEEEQTVQVDTHTVLITGATSGIGKATATVFAQNGYRVILTGRREDRLKELSASLFESFGADCHLLSFDVRDAEAVKKAIDDLPDEWKNVDILINNAGLSRGLDPIHEGKLDDWDTMIDTNVKGLLYMTRAIAPYMVKRKRGHIINISSIAGTEVYPGGNVYSASKAAVSSLTRSMRLDLTKHNIRVSQISPGHVEETEFARVRFDWDTERAAKVYENFQPLTSKDVAETLYFIASRPPHVNIVDIYMYGTQQANATTIERTGR